MEEKKRAAKRTDWEALDMPEKHTTFSIERPVSEAEMEVLKLGHIPQEMEDKWFWYFEDGRLYIHRSWTGICLYILTFIPGSDVIRVIANRDPEQYKCTDDEEDTKRLFKLLTWWTTPDYNYYGEWLSETLDAVKKAKFSIRHEKLTAEGRPCGAVFFDQPDGQNGFLSNSYVCDFHVAGRMYSSIEQYMLFRKCVMFGLLAAAEKILATSDVAQQRAYVCPLKGYQEMLWEGRQQLILMQALYQKFDQNKMLGEALLNTGDDFLVACGRDDRMWSCGAAIDDETRSDIEKWSGKNLLGSTLMEVRKALRHQQEQKRKSLLVIDELDITAMDCDCIVNAANRELLNGGAGVDGAIHLAAGPELQQECLALGGCNTGEAKITRAYRLKTKWVIHTVGPVYSGKPEDAALLASCYRSSLELAKKYDIHSIAFPAISTGTNRYPLREAAVIALTTVRKWLDENEDYILDVIFCCANKQMHELYCSCAKENNM